jgi:hypothetical protein
MPPAKHFRTIEESLLLLETEDEGDDDDGDMALGGSSQIRNTWLLRYMTGLCLCGQYLVHSQIDTSTVLYCNAKC